MVLGAALRLNALAVYGSQFVNAARDGRGPYKRDALHARIRNQRLGRLRPAVYQVDDARRKTGLGDQVHHPRLAQRCLRRRLDDVGIAGGQRVGREPEGHHRRKVERTDLDKNAHRLTDRSLVDAGRDVS